MHTNKHPLWILRVCLSLAVFAGVLSVFLTGLKQTAQAVDAQELQAAQDAIRRAAVECYALEGSYPASYLDLKERYPVAVDERKFAVFYNIFASNVMPEITVIPLEGTSACMQTN